MTRPTVAMVLAAGLGTRMRPLTDHIPKPMVRLAGRPLIDHVLDRLAEAGIATAVVNVHYKAEPLLAHLGARSRPRIVVSDERDALLDTGGGVARALPMLGPEPFLVHNSDAVWMEAAESRDSPPPCGEGPVAAGVPSGESGVRRSPFPDPPPQGGKESKTNLCRLIAAWDERRMDCLLLLARREASLGYAGDGDFALAADGCIRRRGKGETVPFVFAGASILHPRLMADAPAAAFSLNRVWDRAVAAGRAHGLVHDGTWMHIGDPRALAEAERFLFHGGSHGRTY